VSTRKEVRSEAESHPAGVVKVLANGIRFELVKTRFGGARNGGTIELLRR
jgi:hypothetical protein